METVGKEMSMVQKKKKKKKAVLQLRKKLENAFFMWQLLFIGV